MKNKDVTHTGNIGIIFLLTCLIWMSYGVRHDVYADHPSAPAEEVINGISVPPAPNPEENNRTLAGIDINSNGIRDDVERVLAENFGAHADKYNEALKFARAEQRLVVQQDESAISSYIQVVACTSLEPDDSDKLTHALLNTKARSDSYGGLAGRNIPECR